MKKENDLVKVFAGSEITALHLQAELEQMGIPALVKNDFRTGLSAGFPDTTNAVELYVNEKDEKEAEIVVNDFVNNSR